MKSVSSKFLLKVLRFLFIVVPFAWILSNVEIAKLFAAINSIQWWTIPVFLFSILLTMFLQGLRWWVLIRAFSNKLTFFRSLSYHFSSIFYSLILPNSTAQEILRTLFVVKTTGASIGWSTAWISKIIGLIIAFATSIYGLILLSDSALSQTLIKSAMIIFLLICVLVTLSFCKRLTSPMRTLSQKVIPEKYLQKVENLREGIYQFRYKKKSIILTLIITAVSQLFQIFSSIILFKGITGSYYTAECFAYIPLIEIISAAQPITPNGIGIRETLVAFMFKHLQLSSEQLGVYILACYMAILLKLVGAIPVLYNMFFKKNEINLSKLNNNETV